MLKEYSKKRDSSYSQLPTLKSKKLFFIFAFSLIFLIGVVSAANGDVTIVVNNQVGQPISGATATLLLYGGGKGGTSMTGQLLSLLIL